MHALLRTVLLVSVVSVAGCGTKPAVAPATVAPASAAGAQGVFNRPVAAEGLINDIMVAYDHNHDGKLDLNRPDSIWKRLFTADERLRKETTRSVERDPQTREVRRIVYTTYTYTRRDAFYAADGDRDGVVQRQELAQLINAFDKDQDGQLTRRGLWGWISRKEKGEYDLLQTAYGETLADTDRLVIDVSNTAEQARIEKEATLVDAATPIEELKPASL